MSVEKVLPVLDAAVDVPRHAHRLHVVEQAQGDLGDARIVALGLVGLHVHQLELREVDGDPVQARLHHRDDGQGRLLVVALHYLVQVDVVALDLAHLHDQTNCWRTRVRNIE